MAFLSRGGRLVALLVVADAVRPEAREVVAELEALGLRVSLLSGDNRRTTEAVAAALGIGRAVSEVTPVEKRERVAALQASGRRVLVAGDGVNDAPALTQADVGVAMSRGTDVTMESAEAVLVRDDLRLLPELVRLSRKTYRIIRENLFWARRLQPGGRAARHGRAPAPDRRRRGHGGQLHVRGPEFAADPRRGAAAPPEVNRVAGLPHRHLPRARHRRLAGLPLVGAERPVRRSGGAEVPDAGR